MKRIPRVLALLVCLTLLFTSCEFVLPTDNEHAGTTYQITYVADGSVIDLEPSTYVAGEKTELPNLDSERFLGWYTSAKNQVGDPITEISASEYGDKTFYAKYSAVAKPDDSDRDPEKGTDPSGEGQNTDASDDKTEPGKSALTDLFSKAAVGYDYTFSYEDDDEIYDYESEASFYNGNIRYHYEDSESEKTYVDYLAYDAKTDTYTYLLDNGDGTYTAYAEDTDTFSSYAPYVDCAYFFDIVPSHFEGNNGVYSPITDDMLQEDAAAFLGGAYDGETFHSMKITLKNGVPESVVITSTVESDDYGTYNPTYTVSFSNFGKTTFVLPDAEDGDDETLENAIADAYGVEDGETVTVLGVVVGFVGNNFYISDGESGVYIYVGKTPEDTELGDLVTVTGTKTSYKGLVEIKSITAFTVEEKGFEPDPEELENLDNLGTYLSMNVSAYGLTVSGLSGLTNQSGSDISCSVSDGKNTVTFFISKHISTAKRNEIYTLLSGLSDGAVINVEDAVVSCYNEYHIAVTESTVVTTGSLVVTGISANDLTVPVGTTLSSLSSLVSVFENYENGKTSALSQSAFTLSAPTYEANVKGDYAVTVTAGEYSVTLTVSVTDSTLKISKEDLKTVDDIANEREITHGMPSTGDVKVLVIPVDFTDYAAKANTKENLEKAFFGQNLEWESLSSYYEKASYGNLNISGTVLDVFHTGKSSTYYQNRYETNEDGDTLIIKAALEYYDATVDYADYDSDGDGYIDALYIVYSAPIDTENDDSMWWAYTYEYFTEDYEYYDGIEADYYTFLAYDFLFETPASGEDLDLNTETIIHESGHIIGLDDYYDYDDTKGEDGGIGGGDMMDYNVGDHNAFSKLILGWIDPTVILGDCTLTLSSFGESGDCVILPYAWDGSAFSEYLIIDYYTPDGLNGMEAGNSGLFSIDGVRIYHIDATLKTGEVDSMWDIYKFNNSDTAHKLIRLIQADGLDEIEEENGYSDNGDLFSEGAVISQLKWYNGTAINVEITVDSIENGVATLTFDFQ